MGNAERETVNYIPKDVEAEVEEEAPTSVKATTQAGRLGMKTEMTITKGGVVGRKETELSV